MCAFSFCQANVFKQEDWPAAAKHLETSSGWLLIPCYHLLEYIIPCSRYQLGGATGEVGFCQSHIERGLFDRLVMSKKQGTGLIRAFGTQTLLSASLGMFEVVNAIGSAVKAVVIVHTVHIIERGFITDNE